MIGTRAGEMDLREGIGAGQVVTGILGDEGMTTKIATDEMIDIIVTETVIASVALTVIEIRTGTGIGIEEVKDMMMTGIAPDIRHLMDLAGVGIETGTRTVIAILIGGGGMMINEQSYRMRIFNGFGVWTIHNIGSTVLQ